MLEYIIPFIIASIVFLIGFVAGFYWHVIDAKTDKLFTNYIPSQELPLVRGNELVMKVTPLKRPSARDIENKNKSQKQKDTENEMEKIFDEII